MLNKIMLIGRVGKEPEQKPNNGPVVLSLATTEKWKDRNSGERREQTEWHNLVMWGRTGEIALDYVEKGMMLYVEGKVQTDSWQDQETGKTRYSTKINVRNFTMLGGKDKPKSAGNSPRQAQIEAATAAGIARQKGQAPADNFDDDIPF